MRYKANGFKAESKGQKLYVIHFKAENKGQKLYVIHPIDNRYIWRLGTRKLDKNRFLFCWKQNLRSCKSCFFQTQ